MAQSELRQLQVVAEQAEISISDQQSEFLSRCQEPSCCLLPILQMESQSSPSSSIATTSALQRSLRTLPLVNLSILDFRCSCLLPLPPVPVLGPQLQLLPSIALQL